MPCSLTVGTFGNMANRLSAKRAMIFNFPALIWEMPSGGVTETALTWPPSRAVTDGPPPEKGMWLNLTPAAFSKARATRWTPPPAPEFPTVIMSGFFLA